MDRIIYIYPLREVNKECRELKEQLGSQKEQWQKVKGSAMMQDSVKEMYSMEELDMSDYHLVRVGITKELAELCGGDLQRKGAVLIQGATSQSKSSHKKKREGFWRKRRSRKLQQLEQQREQELLEEFLYQIRKVPEESFFVCEETFPIFNRWEFNGYFEVNWVKHMLRYAMAENGAFASPHFLVLGQARCLPEILYPNVAKMKSLKWVLPARQFREELQELVEDIYDEYGLAVDIHLLEDEDAYRRTRISCALPTIVLDFSESDRVPTADITKGSIWLDMASSEEKRRRIEERNTGIHYFSLKKEWKQPRKALFYLDTTSKNGYNT